MSTINSKMRFHPDIGADLTHLSRRAVICGTAALALAGCGTTNDPATGSSSSATGPVINKHEGATTITDEDLAAYVGKLDAALAGSAEEFAALMGANSDAGLWTRWFTDMHAAPMSERRFFSEGVFGAGASRAGQRASQQLTVGFAHRLDGVDTASCYTALTVDVVKDNPDAALVVDKAWIDSYNQELWDLVTPYFRTSTHAVLQGRADDRAVIDSIADTVEQQVAAAYDVFPGTSAPSRVSLCLGWNADGKEWNNQDLYSTFSGDSLLEPAGLTIPTLQFSLQDQANQKKGADKGLAGVRILLNPDLLDDPMHLRRTVIHEAVHALNRSWGPFPRQALWVEEGTARWVDRGFATGILADRAAVAQVKANLERFLSSGVFGTEFYQTSDPTEINNRYYAGALVFAWLETTQSRDAAWALTKAAHESADFQVNGQPVETALADYRAWVMSL